MSNIKKVYSCDCSGEGLVLEIDKEDKYCDVCLSYWTVARKGHNPAKWPLWLRLKWIWHILKDGTPYPTDMVILDIPTARELATDILDATKKRTWLKKEETSG
jgi:hypothetical protein